MIERSSDLEFGLAGPEDDAGIRGLLRDSPMLGDVTISLQREPGYFLAAEREGGEHHTIVACDGAGRVICVGAVVVRERFLNGAPRRVGYLGRLRLAASHAGRFDVVRRGYRFFQSLHERLDLAACFTSIASDNVRARRLLERNLPGLPTYELVAEFATLLLSTAPTRRRAKNTFAGVRFEHGEATGAVKLSSFLNERYSAYQFAPAWTCTELNRFFFDDEQSHENLLVLHDESGLVGCGALWDQRTFKQTVVSGYSKRLSTLRPIYNAFAFATGRTPLPKPATALAEGYVSHLALPDHRLEWTVPAFDRLAGQARRLGLTSMVVGFDARDPRLAVLRRSFRHHSYYTRIYSVRLNCAPAPAIDTRLIYPEAALL